MNLLNTLKQNKLSRFLSVGAINTLFTLVLYQLLVFFIHPSVAYLVSWFTGFVFLLVLYPKYVFGVKRSIKNIFLFASVYLSSVFIGKLAMDLFIHFGANERTLIFFIILLTTIYNYVLINVFLKKRNSITSV